MKENPLRGNPEEEKALRAAASAEVHSDEEKNGYKN